MLHGLPAPLHTSWIFDIISRDVRMVHSPPLSDVCGSTARDDFVLDLSRAGFPIRFLVCGSSWFVSGYVIKLCPCWDAKPQRHQKVGQKTASGNSDNCEGTREREFRGRKEDNEQPEDWARGRRKPVAPPQASGLGVTGDQLVMLMHLGNPKPRNIYT